MLELTAKEKRVTPECEHWYFGYYDIPAFDKTGSRHLCLNVPFYNRLPNHDDVAQLYVIDLDTGAKTKIGETTAWNFQQSCMFQWHPTLENTVIYNVRTPGINCGYGSIIHDLTNNIKKSIDRPVANVSSTGKHAISVNFDRMFDFRPGYGYAGYTDKWIDIYHPADDGIYLTDLETGTSRLIISLDDIWNMTGSFFGGEDQKILINHLTFNTNGTRFVFLARNFQTPSNPRWRTALLTANIDGSDMYLLSDYNYASHYHWRDADTVTFHSAGVELGDLGPQLYELNDLTHTGNAIDIDFFIRDGHNSYSPDRTWMLYDSYPLSDRYRELYLYDLINKCGGLLGRYYSPAEFDGDIRSDLHPIWSPDGKTISFDSIHEGYRGLYTMDLSVAMKELRG